MDNAARDYSQFIDSLGLVIDDNTELGAIDIASLLDIASSLKSSASWAMGDITNLARKTQNDDWINHLSHRVSIRTLNNYASIANKFPRHRRRANLSFSHHDAVKSLPEAEQDIWLDKSEKEQLDRETLRQLIRDIAPVEKREVLATVGSIDKLLTLDFGLPIGYQVKVVYIVEALQEAA